MKTETFDVGSFVAPQRKGRPSKVRPILEAAIQNGEIFAVPVYTSSANRVSGSEQIQSSRVISMMREIAPKWTYAYHAGDEILKLVLVPPKMKVEFDTKKL